MKAAFLSCFLLLNGLGFAQGNVDGFFKSKGDMDVAISGTYVYSRIYFAGVSPVFYKRDQSIIGLYGVYGLSDKWNVVASLPVINFTPQDLSLYAKYKLYSKKFDDGEITILPAFGVSFPVWNYNTESGQAIGQQAVTVQPKLVVQFKHAQNWFVQAQTGYNYSLNSVPSAYVASGKVGFIYKNWYFDAWYDYQFGIGGKDWGSAGLDSFRELGVSYERVGGVVYASIGERLGAFVSISTVLSGRNTSDSNMFNGGIVLKFNTLNKE
jgi:hypothetical protein